LKEENNKDLKYGFLEERFFIVDETISMDLLQLTHELS